MRLTPEKHSALRDFHIGHADRRHSTGWNDKQPVRVVFLA